MYTPAGNFKIYVLDNVMLCAEWATLRYDNHLGIYSDRSLALSLSISLFTSLSLSLSLWSQYHIHIFGCSCQEVIAARFSDSTGALPVRHSFSDLLYSFPVSSLCVVSGSSFTFCNVLPRLCICPHSYFVPFDAVSVLISYQWWVSWGELTLSSTHLPQHLFYSCLDLHYSH